MSDETKDQPADDEGAPRDAPQDEPSASAESAESKAAESAEKPAAEGGAEDDAEAKAKAAAAAKAKAEAIAKKKAEHAAAEAAKEVWERDPIVPDWEPADEDPLVEALRASHPDAIESAQTFAGDLTLVLRRESIRDVCATLKEEHAFALPVDICGADYPDREEGRFDVVYHLYSFEANRRIRLRVVTDEETAVPSVSSVWRFANWPEREAYDMYGIRFSDHPDLTRILLWEGFNGHPLRKDFPVEGIDTGAAIYPEYYEEDAGPVAGTGTGWKPPAPPEPEPPEAAAPEATGETPSGEQPGEQG